MSAYWLTAAAADRGRRNSHAGLSQTVRDMALGIEGYVTVVEFGPEVRDEVRREALEFVGGGARPRVEALNRDWEKERRRHHRGLG